METGKTLAELDVKEGDVVSWKKVNEYTIGGIRDNGHYYNKDSGLWFSLSNGADWHLVSRATPQEPAKPRKMHPDDFVIAVNDFARDNGFGVSKIEFHGCTFSDTCLPFYKYSVL